MDKSCVMNNFDGIQHLDQQSSRIWPRNSLIREVPLYFCQIRAQELHYDEVGVSLGVVNEVMDFSNVLLVL